MADEAEGELGEVEWVKTKVVPLLRRLGFVRVVFNHGSSERGKDVVFADLDRFGLLRYYAAQAKREVISAKDGGRDFETLCSQLRSAYDYEFADPTSGRRVKMSGVYLLAMGPVTQQARERLVERTGQWLHFVDSDQLVVAKHLSAWPHPEEQKALLDALFLEINLLAHRHLDALTRSVEAHRSRTGGGVALPGTRFRFHTADAADPFLHAQLSRGRWADADYTNLLNYRINAEQCNVILDAVGLGGGLPKMAKTWASLEYLLSVLPGQRLAALHSIAGLRDSLDRLPDE